MDDGSKSQDQRYLAPALAVTPTAVISQSQPQDDPAEPPPSVPLLSLLLTPLTPHILRLCHFSCHLYLLFLSSRLRTIV